MNVTNQRSTFRHLRITAWLTVRIAIQPSRFRFPWARFVVQHIRLLRIDGTFKGGTGDDVRISVKVKNSSGPDGDEVVQCYINRDLPTFDPASLPEPSTMTRAGNVGIDAAQDASDSRECRSKRVKPRR